MPQAAGTFDSLVTILIAVIDDDALFGRRKQATVRSHKASATTIFVSTK
jgi:hypothetical protein